MKRCFTLLIIIFTSISYLNGQNQMTINLNNGESEIFEISDIKELNILGNIINVESISLEVESIELKADETYQAEYSITPTNATNQEVNWNSGNNSIASVDDNGLITALSIGETTIFVETIDGNFTDQLSVSVTPLTTVESLDNDIRIYPNPVHSTLNIETGDINIFTIVITDISGNVIKSESNQNKIDFSNLPAGSYFLTLAMDGKQYNYSIIKK